MTRKDDINSLKGGMVGGNTIFDKITVRKDCVVPTPDADSEAATKKYVDDSIPVASTTVAAETTFGISASAGTAATRSKGDHTHGTPTAPSAIFNTQTDVYASRAANSTYQNQNAVPIMVNVGASLSLICSTSSTMVSGQSQIVAYCGSSAVTTQVAAADFYANIVTISSTATQGGYIGSRATVTFIVPASYYYKVASTTSGDGFAPSIECWIEYGGTAT